MIIIFSLGLLLFAAVVFAIYKGYGVKAAMKWLGASLTFEAQKDK
jgi:hypothetical protein